MNFLKKAFQNLKGAYSAPKNIVEKAQSKEILDLLIINPKYKNEQ